MEKETTGKEPISKSDTNSNYITKEKSNNFVCFFKNHSWVIHSLLILIISIPLCFLFYSIIDENSTPKIDYYRYEKIIKKEPLVYVTNTGDCYHNGSCGYLSRSKNRIGLYKAIEDGYVKCSVCHGTPFGYIDQEYTKKIPVYKDETIKFIFESSLISILVASATYGVVLYIISSVKNNRNNKKSNQNEIEIKTNNIVEIKEIKSEINTEPTIEDE